MEENKNAVVKAIIVLLALTEEERLEVFQEFCTHCGIQQSDGYQCQCWNDD